MIYTSIFFVALFIFHQYGAEAKHYNNLIVGAGPSGLYTAYRLSSPEGKPNQSTAIFEWSPERVGGRICTKHFDSGQLLELGGMRFTHEHKLLQHLLEVLDLKKEIIDFPVTKDRLYYLRGKHFRDSEIGNLTEAPYNTRHEEHRNMTPSQLSKLVADNVLGKNPPITPKEWCNFFDNGILADSFKSDIFKGNESYVGNIGYWNLLYDQLGIEGFNYVKDAGGYSGNVINRNAAQTLHSSSQLQATDYKTLVRGYSSLWDTLAEKCKNQSVEINLGHRLTDFHWNADTKKFNCTFLRYNENGTTGKKTWVTSDKLFLSVPANSLQNIREDEVVGNFKSMERKVLKNRDTQFFIESVIKQPAIKIGLLYENNWWMNATYAPTTNKAEQVNYGPTITDLPLRQIYYMGNNKPTKGKPFYGILASYGDTDAPYFWRSLGLSPGEFATMAHSEDLLPLTYGKKVPSVMLQMVREQLNEVHYGHNTNITVPEASDGYLMNWNLMPYEAGYHAWKPHYKLKEAQYHMTRPTKNLADEVPLYITGSAYSNMQGWVEGALSTAESILTDKAGEFNLPRIVNDRNHLLICRTDDLYF